MMTKTLLSWDDNLGITNLVKCDAIVALKDQRRTEVTRHAVENGSSISDHVIHQPDSLVIDVRHSNTPIYEQASLTAQFSRKPLNLSVQKSAFKPAGLFLIHSAAGALVGAVLGGKKKPLKPYTIQATQNVDRIVELHDKLIEARNKAHQITIEQYGRRYEDYVLTGVEYERSGGQGGLANFRLELETVRTVQTATTELPDPAKLHAKPARSRGSKSSKLSSKNPEDVMPPSPLSQITGAVGKAFSGAIR